MMLARFRWLPSRLICGLALYCGLAGHARSFAEERPGGVMVASNRLVSQLVERSIVESQRHAGTIGGTYTEGIVNLQGRLVAHLIPETRFGLVELQLLGTALLDDGRGQAGPVTIHSSSRTNIDARKRIMITPDGIRWEASTAQCQTEITIHDLEARRRIIERIAWRRAERDQPKIEREASAEAERRTAESFDKLADRGLKDGDKILRRNMGNSIENLSLASRLRISTTPTQLRAHMIPSEKLETLTTHPPIDPQHDGAALLNDKLVTEICEKLLAGTTSKDDEILRFMRLLVGSPPQPLWVHDREPRWSLKFADEKPLAVRFEENLVGFSIRVASVTLDGEEMREPVTIDANYRLEKSVDGPVLVRQGGLAVWSESPESNSQSAPQRLLRRKFSGVFLPEIHFAGLMPPAGSNWAPLRALKLTELASQGGWFTIGYQINPDSKYDPLPLALGSTQ